MAAGQGTRAGTGYVDIEPDLSRFQGLLAKQLTPHMRDIGVRAGREIGKGSDRGLAQSLNPFRRRFQKIGDEAGKVIADKIGKGATKAKGDMFGLADAIGEVEKRSRRTGQASKGLERDMFGVNRTARASGRSIKSASAQLKDWSSGARGAGGASRRFTDQLRGLGAELRKTSRDARTAGGGFGGFNGGIARVNRGFSFFRNILRTLKWPLLIASLGLATQGLSALAAGAVAATSALGSLAGALVTLPAAATLAAQAIGALKLATAGVGDAVKAALDAEVQGGTQAVDVLRQQEDAAEGVADAKRNLASVQRQAQLAQEDLTQAREEARRELEDMRLAADESGDSVESAVLSLRRAQQELRRAMRDPEASILDVREAEESVDQAQNDLERTRLDAKRAREDYRDAQKAGVEGMPQVVAAKRAEADANRAVQDAQRDLTRAVRDSTAAMEEQGTAASAFHEKMSQLPPAAQKFVRVLVGMKPRLDALRASAAEGFFPGAERGLRAVLKNFGPVRGIVDETSRAFGRLAERAGEQFGSAEWGRDLRKIGRTNTKALHRMGEAGLNLADAFRHILVSARPFLNWLSESTLQLSEWIEGEAKAGRESGRLAEFFDRTRQTMELLGPILKGVGGALLNIGEAARPLGNEILDSLGNAAEGWRRWTDSTKGQNRLKTYFTETKPAIFEMGRLIRDAGKAFFELGRQSGVAHLLRLVRTELIPAMRDLVGATTGWASEFLRDFGRLRREGVPAFDAFVQVLAEHAAEAGWRIAKGLGNAFLNASIWGKLAIGGWFLHKLGAFKALREWGFEAGANLGKSFFKSAAKWIAGTQAGESLLGWFQGTFGKGGRFTGAARTSGSRIGKAVGRGVVFGTIASVIALAPLIAEKLQKHVLEPIEEKINGTLNDLIPFGDPFAEGPKVSLRELEAQGISAKEINAAVGWEAFEIPAPKMDKALGRLRDFRERAGKEGERTRTTWRNQISLLPEIAERSGQRVLETGLPPVKRFGRRSGGVVVGLAGTFRGALGNIMANLSQALTSLNVGKVPKFSFKKLETTLPELERQRGGPVVPAFATGGLASVVPGNSTGDRHTLSINGVPVAKVESREGIFVGNRKLMGVLQRANDAVPRFQAGGSVTGSIVPVPGFPGERINSRVLNTALGLMRRFNLFLTDAFGPDHKSAEHTQFGTAIDVVPGAGGSWADVGKAVSYAVRQGFNPVYYDGSGGSIDLPPHGPGHHAHMTLLTVSELLRGVLPGGVTAQLKKIALAGPDGPLKRLGQAAIDRVHKAASQFLQRVQPTVSGGGLPGAPLTGSGNVEEVFAEVARRLSQSKIASLALGMAGYAESGMRDLGYGDSSSEGALQLLASTAAGLGIDPHDEAAVSSAFLTRGFYGRGGANKLAAEGLPAHLVAQSVQGSAFSDGSNYLAQEGSAKGWMRRFGLKVGGLLKLPGFQKGGGDKGEGRRRGRPKYAPMQRQLERLKGLGLDDTTLGELSSRIRSLTGLSEQAETFSEFASNASSLRIEPENGPAIPGLFQGRPEGEWLLSQLQALGSLRNELIAARTFVEGLRERVRKMMERAQKQVEELKAQIQRAIQKRVRLMGALGGAREALAKAREDKDPERRKERVERAQGTIAQLLERIGQLDFHQSQRKELVNHLGGEVLPRLTERMSGLESAFTGTLEGGEGFMGLNALQGRGGPMNQIATYGADQPAIGTLGGEILGVQSRLREIAEDARVKATSGDDSERVGLAEKLAREAAQREGLTAGLFADFRQFAQSYGLPKLPKFHEGGILPGPRGQEVPFMGLGGEGVFTEEQMEAMGRAGGNAGGLVIESLTIHKDGRVTARMGGRELEAEVKRIVQDMDGTGRLVAGGPRRF